MVARAHVHQHLVGGRAEAAAEDYSSALVAEILRGIRETADAEEAWGDKCSADLTAKLNSVGAMHDVRDVSVAAADRAERALEDQRLAQLVSRAEDCNGLTTDVCLIRQRGVHGLLGWFPSLETQQGLQLEAGMLRCVEHVRSVRKRVVELGSGTGLAGLACAAAGASHVRGQSFQPPSLARLGTVLSGEPLHPPCR